MGTGIKIGDYLKHIYTYYNFQQLHGMTNLSGPFSGDSLYLLNAWKRRAKNGLMRKKFQGLEIPNV